MAGARIGKGNLKVLSVLMALSLIVAVGMAVFVPQAP